MTNKIDDLFGEKPKRTKAKRRVMAHMIDGGDGVLFGCSKCGWESGWLSLDGFKEKDFRCGIPCEVCN